MAESWVINASPTILLAKAGLIELLPRLCAEFVIPEPVVAEILNVRGPDAAARWLEASGKQFVRPAVAELAALAGSNLGSGERAVISWAAANPGFVAVLDDLEARVIAQKLGVPLRGTVGVVLRLKNAALISDAKTHLQNIRAAGGYISEVLFNAAVRQAREKL